MINKNEAISSLTSGEIAYDPETTSCSNIDKGSTKKRPNTPLFNEHVQRIIPLDKTVEHADEFISPYRTSKNAQIFSEYKVSFFSNTMSPKFDSLKRKTEKAEFDENDEFFPSNTFKLKLSLYINA